MRRAKTLGLFELAKMYPTKQSAIRYFESVRWCDNTRCAKCGSANKLTRQRDEFNYWCGSCRNYFNVFTNTPLERNKIDPRKWIFAAYLMVTSRKGISSMQLSKE